MSESAGQTHGKTAKASSGRGNTIALRFPVKVDDKNAAKDSSSPGSSHPSGTFSGAKSRLSSQSMQRKAQELNYAAKTREDATAATGGEEVALNTILRSQKGNSLIRYCPGGRSFGGFNKPVALLCW
eukprot:759596-Hanusia_phi.AAC.1